MPKKRGKKIIKLNEEHIIDIKESFKLFDKEDSGEIHAKDLEKAISALELKLTKDEIENILKEISEDLEGKISYDTYFEIVSTRMSEKNTEKDVSNVFAMFDVKNTGKIRWQDLKRVAHELGEKLSEEDMKEMIEYTSGDGKGYVTQKDFKKILERTGIY